MVLNTLASSPLFQFTLGGFEQLQGIKVRKREELGLPPLPEDSIRVIRSMRAASPPASASDLIEQQQKRARREHKVSAAGALQPAFTSIMFSIRAFFFFSNGLRKGKRKDKRFLVFFNVNSVCQVFFLTWLK